MNGITSTQYATSREDIMIKMLTRLYVSRMHKCTDIQPVAVMAYIDEDLRTYFNKKIRKLRC
jgi:hypothetical protein